MAKIEIILTAEQLAVFEQIGRQMRAGPAEVILSAACGYVDTGRDEEAAEYSSVLFSYSVSQETPDQPKLWEWFKSKEPTSELGRGLENRVLDRLRNLADCGEVAP